MTFGFDDVKQMMSVVTVIGEVASLGDVWQRCVRSSLERKKGKSRPKVAWGGGSRVEKHNVTC